MKMYWVALIFCAVVSGGSGTGMDTFSYTNECYLNPCYYGTCVDGDRTYTCNCDPGYTGRRCCSDIDECVSNGCVNGTCVDGINGYTCVCDDGFEGDLCDQDVDDCIDNTCINATCVDGLGDFVCECPANSTGSCDWRTYDLTEGYLDVEASTSGWGGSPEDALDGLKDGRHDDGTPCYHNHGDDNPWWKVTLKQAYNIRRVVVTNRLENQSNRFRDMSVKVDGVLCANYPGPANQNQLTIEITCERTDLIGQEIEISHYGDLAVLTLCEVEVFKF